MNDDSNKLTLADGDALFVAAVSTALGCPVPPTIAKNIIQGVGAMVAGALEVPTAYFVGWAQEIRAESQARATLTENAAEIALRTIEAEPELKARATANLGRRLLREQNTRERVTRDALEDLKANAPVDDATSEIDADWLYTFARHAESKTNADVQAYFAKVLSGEIRKPGSFAPETIEVLAKLSPSVGKLFQDFCSLTMTLGDSEPPFLLCSPFGAPGTNALEPVGFTYPVICRLQDAGLVRSDFTTHYTFPVAILSHAVLANERMPIIPVGPSGVPQNMLEPMQHSALTLTQAGIELRRIVHVVPNPTYKAKLVDWLTAMANPKQ